jgi:lipopolysaccharide export system permease protein
MDEIVGKGLEYKVIAELFFYAAIGLVPNALPISILFASLMAFGNLGESFELVSMKSAGIPLMRIMKPLIFFMIFVCIALYLFQNHVIPETQKRMYTLLYSVKRKAPELEIPVGSFYSQIDGYNLYVKKKTPATGLLEDLTIYRLTDGFENATIIVADSGYLKMTDDKQALMFYLYKGELFGNLEKQQYAKDKVPYRREIFDQKQILIPFDANFNRMDDSFMKDKYVSKNTAQLQQTADSLTLFVDSLRRTEAISLKKYT